jgi:hypothetical protein
MNQVVDDAIQYIETYFPEFKLNPEKDIRFFSILLEEFPDQDLLEELKLFHAWTMDVDSKITTPRIRFRKWIRNSFAAIY